MEITDLIVYYVWLNNLILTKLVQDNQLIDLFKSI